MKIISIIAAGTMLFASSLFAQSQARSTPTAQRDDNSRYTWADVLRVDPIYDDNAPSNQSMLPCYEEQVPVHAPPPDEDNGKRSVGGMLGAIVGGILGHQAGKGDGRKVATVGGAVAGAVVGSNAAGNADREHAEAGPPDAQKYTIERRCPGSESAARHIVAYDVEYRYRADVYTSRLNYDPGDRLRVKVTVSPAD